MTPGVAETGARRAGCIAGSPGVMIGGDPATSEAMQRSGKTGWFRWEMTPKCGPCGATSVPHVQPVRHRQSRSSPSGSDADSTKGRQGKTKATGRWTAVGCANHAGVFWYGRAPAAGHPQGPFPEWQQSGRIDHADRAKGGAGRKAGTTERCIFTGGVGEAQVFLE